MGLPGSGCTISCPLVDSAAEPKRKGMAAHDQCEPDAASCMMGMGSSGTSMMPMPDPEQVNALPLPWLMRLKRGATTCARHHGHGQRS